jgi:hypothetical protein
VSEHLKNIFADNELEQDAVIRNFRITAADGKNYNTQHYNLSATIAVGYKVNSERAVQFRKWALCIFNKFDALTNSITEGLSREIELRQKQYAHYRDLLLSFPKPQEVVA